MKVKTDDLPSAVWRIGKTKNGTPQNVPLSPEAAMVLTARQERAQASPFVFPGTGKTLHLVEPKKAWATVLRTASLFRLLDALKLDDAQRAGTEHRLAKGRAHETRLHRPHPVDVKTLRTKVGITQQQFAVRFS